MNAGVHWGQRGPIPIPQHWNYGIVSCLMWVLELKFRLYLVHIRKQTGSMHRLKADRGPSGEREVDIELPSPLRN